MSDLFQFPEIIRPESQLTLQQRLEDAYQKGVNDGRLAGEELGRQWATDELRAEMEMQCQKQLQQQKIAIEADNCQQLAQLMNGVKLQLQINSSQLSEDLYTLIRELAQTVIESELSGQPQSYLTAIERTLEALQGRDIITAISVAASDNQWLKSQGVTDIDGIPFRVDESLPAGQVQFEGETQLHQLSFRQRLAELLQQIKPILTDAD
ncbi:FliH/SctL family protein [Shewanella sp. A32]|uniref:FliH/SctL family protein n=1 Tax=Shewanella sp. A32 TaxID=3031327 RepID=UPI0023BA1448|nr:FliH/SctL family protein [Shewanella sp. A32]MDF0535709.1 FliH/SctL family protein [Shewanella sp. A32]